MLASRNGFEIPESGINNALSKLSWKLLKKELDKVAWKKNPRGLLDIIMRADSLINKRTNAEKAKKRQDLIAELTLYISPSIDEELLKLFKHKLGFFEIADTCFSEVLSFEGELDALKDLSPAKRMWSTMIWFVEDQNHLYEKIAEQFTTDKPVLINSLTVTGESGVPVDPSAYHTQQVDALGSAILMEAYRNNWFCPKGNVIIPDRLDISDTEVFKAGSVLYNANIWALVDTLQEQVRYLGRAHTRREPNEFESPPEGFKFGLELGGPTSAQIFDFIASQRNTSREFSNFFSFKKDSNLNKLLDAVSKVSGSTRVKDHYQAASSLSTLLNYEVLEDETLYEGLTIGDWIDGFCAAREYCASLISANSRSKPMVSELLTFTQADIEAHVQSCGLSKEKSSIFINNITFHRKARDLFDAPLIRTSSGFAVISDILRGSVISRAVASNILGRKGEFKPKGDGLEAEVKEIFLSHGIEAATYEKKYPEPEGKYQYDVLALWEGSLFVLECKNRWLCEGRPVAIYNYLKQCREDLDQVSRLVNGLTLHPEMVREAFGREVSYNEIIPCVVAGLPHAISEQISGVYFTDISVITRFFSDRFFGAEYADRPKEKKHILYDQWETDTPSVSDFIKALRNPRQVAITRATLDSRTVEHSVGRAVFLKSSYLYAKPLDLDDYRTIMQSL